MSKNNLLALKREPRSNCWLSSQNELPLPGRVSLAYCYDPLSSQSSGAVAMQHSHTDFLGERTGQQGHRLGVGLAFPNGRIGKSQSAPTTEARSKLRVSVECASIYRQFRILNSLYRESLSCAAGNSIKGCFVWVIVHCTKHSRDLRCFSFVKKYLTSISII